MHNLANLVVQAVAELGITKPVVRIDASASGDGLDLWTLGAEEPVTWEPPAPAKKSRAKKAAAKEK